jgi:hypothetical protein
VISKWTQKHTAGVTADVVVSAPDRPPGGGTLPARAHGPQRRRRGGLGAAVHQPAQDVRVAPAAAALRGPRRAVAAGASAARQNHAPLR